DALCEVAEPLDEAGEGYLAAVEAQREAVERPDATPSGRLLDAMRDSGESFFEHVRGIAERHHAYFVGMPIDAERETALEALAVSSLEEQAALEKTETLSFTEYLREYFSEV